MKDGRFRERGPEPSVVAWERPVTGIPGGGEVIADRPYRTADLPPDCRMIDLRRSHRARKFVAFS
jgi:hypothetical protein